MARGTFYTLDRRRFLLLSSAGVLGCSALAAPALGHLLPVADRDLLLGYGAEIYDSAEIDGGPDVLPAANRQRVGEPRMLRTGARMVVEGLRGDAERLVAEGFRHAALIVRFPGDDTDGRFFTAWSFTSAPVCSVGHSCEFNVPVDAEGLEISLETEMADPVLGDLAVDVRRFTTRLVTGSDQGAAKLLPGTYAVPLVQASAGGWFNTRVAVRDEPCLMVSIRPAASKS